MPQISTRLSKPLRRAFVVLAGLMGLLLTDLVAGAYGGSLHGLGSHEAHTMVADAPTVGRGPTGYPAERLLDVQSVVKSPCARVSSAQSAPQTPDAPTPMQAPESGLGSVEADDELNDLDDFAYHLRVVFDGTAQLNRIVEPGMSLGGRALSRLEDDRNHKPPRS